MELLHRAFGHEDLVRHDRDEAEVDARALGRMTHVHKWPELMAK